MCAEDNFYFWGAISRKRVFFNNENTGDLINFTHQNNWRIRSYLLILNISWRCIKNFTNYEEKCGVIFLGFWYVFRVQFQHPLFNSSWWNVNRHVFFNVYVDSKEKACSFTWSHQILCICKSFLENGVA